MFVRALHLGGGHQYSPVNACQISWSLRTVANPCRIARAANLAPTPLWSQELGATLSRADQDDETATLDTTARSPASAPKS